MDTRFLASLVLLAFCTVALAQNSFWKDEKGNPTAETDSRKSKNDFGGWLLVTSDQDWQERWERPTGPAPSFTEAKTASIGQRLFTLIIFGNPALDASGSASVQCDIRVTRPNGTRSIDARDVVCFQGRVEGSPSALFLSEPIIAYVGEPKDPKGEWLVEVHLKDLVRKTTLELKTSFTLR
jgi:hypothetical protein